MNQAVEAGIIYITRHKGEPLTIAEVSKAAGYSKFYYSRLFKATMGMTLNAFIVRSRLTQAAKDIYEGESILSVALKYHYETHTGFGKAFKKVFGYSPNMLHALRMARTILNHEEVQVMEPNTLWHELIASIQQYNGEDAVKSLTEAYDKANLAHEGQVRYSGEPYITHPLNVALILAQMELPIDVVCLGLLHECCGNDLSRPADSEAERYVKVADRLHNMRTIRFLDASKWREKAVATLEEFLPLAEQLGLPEMTSELTYLATTVLEIDA